MNLSNHPNEIVATTNDNEAKALLAELGVLEKLEHGSARPELLANYVMRLDVVDHPTHWITAIRYIGFKRAEDNGFAVRCIPKNQVTAAEFKLQSETEKKEEFSSGMTEQIGDFPPTGNN